MTMTNDRGAPFHVTIIGSGITGITLAIALHKRGVPFTIFDQSQNFTEIGAGIAFSPNAIRAMTLCDPRVKQSLDKVATGNLWKEKQAVYFDWVDGHTKTEDGKERFMFSIDRTGGPNEKAESCGCHRAQFLEEQVKLIPSECTRFGKRLESVEQTSHDDSRNRERRLQVTFKDGSSVETDCVIGCDGIKSRVRRIVLGEDNPQSHPHYSHKYAYRGLVPMEKAIEALGEDMAGNRHMHSGPEGHILTFPVAKGRLMNVVAFHDDPNPWPDPSRLTLPSQKSAAIQLFADWNPTVKKIMDMLLDDLDCWGIFDTYDHPASTYHKGCICIVGDAAHASSPHHGAGAGACIEDAAILAELLLEAKNVSQRQACPDTATLLEKTFAAYEAVRLERTQWLVASSRRTGDIFDWMDPECGRDPAKMEQELLWRHNKIWWADIEAMVSEAKEHLRGAVEALR